MTQDVADAACHAGGFLNDVAILDGGRTEFVAEPLGDDVVVGGPATLRLHVDGRVSIAQHLNDVPRLRTPHGRQALPA